MRIAFINDTFGTGSIGRLTKELADSLILYGHNVKYFYAQGTGDVSYCVKISNRNGQRTHAILSRLTGLQGYFSGTSTSMLLRELIAFSPDIVHLQNLHSNYINLKILGIYLKTNHIATVITLHDCWFYTGKCTYYVPANCKKWESGCGKCPLLHYDNVNPTFFFDTTHKCLADKEKWFAQNRKVGIVGVSHWVTNEAKKSIYRSRKITCIYNWVDQDIFHYYQGLTNAELGLPDRKIVLMVSTNLSIKKGYQELVYLAQKLPKDYQVVYIGGNKQGLAIPPNVIHIAHTNTSQRLAEYYSIAAVCVNTTQFETFGMVTAEAISCGTPVIVYKNTASPELIGEGCGAVVCRKEEILGAVSELSSGDREQYRKKCTSWAKIQFSKERGVNKYIQFYEELIDIEK